MSISEEHQSSRMLDIQDSCSRLRASGAAFAPGDRSKAHLSARAWRPSMPPNRSCRIGQTCTPSQLAGLGWYAGACCDRLWECMPSSTLAVLTHHVTKGRFKDLPPGIAKKQYPACAVVEAKGAPDVRGHQQHRCAVHCWHVPYRSSLGRCSSADHARPRRGRGGGCPCAPARSSTLGWHSAA